jgi:hypothetical protein
LADFQDTPPGRPTRESGSKCVLATSPRSRTILPVDSLISFWADAPAIRDKYRPDHFGAPQSGQLALRLQNAAWDREFPRED